nr:immunoglobulin light chain junction region [Macaca mulatta]
DYYCKIWHNNAWVF